MTIRKPKGSLLDRLIEGVIQDVCELPDRTSPEDQPEMMLVTGEELDALIRNRAEALKLTPADFTADGAQKLYRMAEAGRRYWDASFYVGMCEASADPEHLASGNHSKSEHAEAVRHLARAREEETDAVGELCRQFSGPTQYPMTADELNAEVLSCGAAPRPLSSAPRDGTLLSLLVDYSGDDGAHPLEDAVQAWTVGANNFANDGEDVWRFAGWCWSHDHYTEGKGQVIGWLPWVGGV